MVAGDFIIYTESNYKTEQYRQIYITYQLWGENYDLFIFYGETLVGLKFCFLMFLYTKSTQAMLQISLQT